jgi:hypothetical protein
VRRPSYKILFGGDDIGVDAEGVDEAPRVDMLTEASCFGFFEGAGKGPLANIFWQRRCW